MPTFSLLECTPEQTVRNYLFLTQLLVSTKTEHI